MRRLATVALLLAGAISFAGCLGQGDDPTSPAATNDTDLNPWQVGLYDSYPTPGVAEHRSAEERRGNVAEPGDPRFSSFDAVIDDWMAEHNATAGQFALMYQGALRYEAGYGHVDREGTETTGVDTMFRIASVTKPMTGALVAMQVEEGLYNWTDPVFCLPADDSPPACRLPIEPHPTFGVADERVKDVQVRHLVNDSAGWGSVPALLFDDGPLEIAGAFDVAPPPETWQTASALLGEPLEHAPGQETAYCNVCYTLAGLVAEAATGAELGALYEAYLFDPLEVSGAIEPGHTLQEQRNPREPFYPCQGLYGQGQYEPNATVCVSNGGFALEESFLAPGGLVSTAAATAAIYTVYADHGIDWSNDEIEVHGHTGSLRPGTSSLAVRAHHTATPAGSVQFAALFNSWNGGCEEGPEDYLPGPGGDCPRHELMRELLPLALAWAEAEHARTG